MSVGYYERVWLNWWVWTFAIIVVAMLSVPLLGRTNLATVERPSTQMLYLFFLLDAFAIFLTVNFRKIDIQIDREGVRVRFGVLMKTISAKEIVVCKPVQMKLPLYGGIGLRLGEHDLPHYKAGHAVEITVNTGKTSMIPTNNPQELSEIINNISGR